MSEPRWLTPAEQAAWRSFLFAQLLVSDVLDEQLRRDAHMSHDYYGMLARLSEVPERRMRMSDLAEVTASSPSRLTHAISNLVRLGWVTRTPCPEDRRVQFAVLTDEGLAALRRAAPGHVEAVRSAIFDALSAEQVDRLHEVMSTIVAHLNPGVADDIALDTVEA